MKKNEKKKTKKTKNGRVTRVPWRVTGGGAVGERTLSVRAVRYIQIPTSRCPDRSGVDKLSLGIEKVRFGIEWLSFVLKRRDLVRLVQNGEKLTVWGMVSPLGGLHTPDPL